jgi:hypothetical protein
VRWVVDVRRAPGTVASGDQSVKALNKFGPRSGIPLPGVHAGGQDVCAGTRGPSAPPGCAPAVLTVGAVGRNDTGGTARKWAPTPQPSPAAARHYRVQPPGSGAPAGEALRAAQRRLSARARITGPGRFAPSPSARQRRTRPSQVTGASLTAESAWTAARTALLDRTTTGAACGLSRYPTSASPKGAASVLVGILLRLRLPSRPEDASWPSAEEAAAPTSAAAEAAPSQPSPVSTSQRR